MGFIEKDGILQKNMGIFEDAIGRRDDLNNLYKKEAQNDILARDDRCWKSQTIFKEKR